MTDPWEEQERHEMQAEWEDAIMDENAKLRDALKALMVGTNAELCGDRDKASCEGCSMRRDDSECTMTEAMELLGCDAYGEPMEVEG